MPRNMTRGESTRRIVLGASIALTLCFPAFAQRGTPGTPEKGNTRIRIPQMSDRAIGIPGLGVSVRVPEDALIEITSPDTGATGVRIWPQSEQGWEIKIFNTAAAGPRTGVTEILNSLIRAHQEQFPVADVRDLRDTRDLADPRRLKYTLSRIVERQKNLVIGQGKMRGERVYLDVPAAPAAPAIGYTVFRQAPGQFIVFALECESERLSEARVVYEAFIAACRFEDPEVSQAERAVPALAGARLLDSLTRDDVESAFTESEHFYRIYKPEMKGGRIGEEEVAWQRISFRKGQIGELNKDRDRRDWTKAEREFGYIVQIDARVVRDDRVADSSGLFFLSTDLESERWSIHSEASRDGNLITRALQTVVRRGERMTVLSEQEGEPSSSFEYQLPNNYIPKVVQYLLPRIVAQQDMPGNYAFYNYDPALGKVTLRYESFDKRPTKGWVQTTRYTESTAPVTTYLDERGTILRQEMAGSQVMEPIAPGALRQLWMRKGLPTR